MVLQRELVAEAFGTFALVFVGTGAIITNDLTGGVVGHVGVALAFGLVVMAMIYALGDVSGAHLNPAVTFGFFVAKRLPGSKVLPYVTAQLAGATTASGVLRFLFEHETLGATQSAHPFQGLVLEFLLTWILMLVILRVSIGARETGIMAGAAIGSVVAFEALFGGPISGASMNPARSLAPALWSGFWEHQWIYLLGPILGASAAVYFCRLMQTEGCCGTASEAGAEPPPQC